VKVSKGVIVRVQTARMIRNKKYVYSTVTWES